ncbi:aldo/keto reductase [Mycobacteroides chelonae]|nr:aldo/keto reductase [Mycobacteroides chelonae]MEC4839328.1 aldo/keto reductase [Mycobacteroides chelonae]MEC4844560.1 aldo/keto reductase [Mycobacteroides chelonae]WED93790.1 aldo/keto reductase [Mycobacteroides chelonae]WED98388.1 aldo/keto reductase [Mycobacteroides chelonae]
MTSTRPIGAGTLTLGGDITVNRLGYGTMQLTGAGVWGPPRDPASAVRVLKRAVELGVNFLDTADAYGPQTVEDLITEALHPYPGDLTIATKVGLVRTGPAEWGWIPLGRPEYLRQQTEMSLRRLRLERIDLLQLHRVDPTVPFEDQIGELKLLRDEGKIRHIGLSEVSVSQLHAARQIVPIASVQNLFNLANRSAADVVDYATAHGIAFIPYFPLATEGLEGPGGALDVVARAHGASAAQIALAWLLRSSPNVLPIPGTSSEAHLAQNLAAADITLSDAEFEALSAAVPPLDDKEI